MPKLNAAAVPMPTPGQLVWTALPAGWSPTNPRALRLSVVVTPQLTGQDPGATMVSLPLLQGDGSAAAVNWTSLAASLQLEFFFAGLQDAVAASPLPGNLDRTLWPLVFPDTLPIGDFSSGAAQSVAAQPTQSYSVDAAVNLARGVINTPPVYNGGGGHRLPSIMRLAGLVPDAAEQQDAVHQHARQLRRSYGSKVHEYFAQGSGGFTAEMLHFADMDNFYTGLATGAQQRYANATQNSPAPAPLSAPDFDFHTTLTALSRYPSLLRALGLILDFEVDLGDALADIAPLGKLSVGFANTPFGDWTLVQPTTLVALDAANQGFYLAGVGAIPELSQGYFEIPANPTVYSLRLDALAHTLYAQVVRAKAQASAATPDAQQSGMPAVGGTGSSTHQASVAGQSASTKAPEATAITASAVPAPTSSGLTLALSNANSLIGTLEAMLAAQAAAASSATPTAPDFTAETLVRGFRVDVQRTTDAAWHSLHLRNGSYVFPDGRTESWSDEGWLSLNAFNPAPDGAGASLWAHENLFLWQGWSLSAPRPGQISNAEGQLMSQSDPSITGTNLNVNIDFTPTPTTLLPLRFGVTYNCRLRSVDLAGYSLPLSTPTTTGATASLGTFLRHDVAPPPVLLARDAFGPGESMGIAAIRSDVGEPASATAARLIVPPKTSLHLAEWHGALDVSGTLNTQLFADQTFAARLAGKLPPAPYGGNPPAVPYLPDAAVTGAILDANPATGGTVDTSPVTTLPFTGTWPALNPWQLLLQEGPQNIAVDITTSTVTVSLPKAAVLSLNLQSSLADEPADGSPGGIGLFDYWNAVKSGAVHVTAPQTIDTVHQDILNGRVNQMTPPTPLQLVHAVQRPLVVSSLSPGATVGRETTSATIAGAANIDGASTGKAELMASWSEWVDDGINPPAQTSFQCVAASTTVLPTDTQWQWNPGAALPQSPMQQEFNDTRARQVDYSIVTTTRFLEYFPADVTSDPANVTQTGPPMTLNIPCSANPPAPKVLYAIPLLQFQEAVGDDGGQVHVRTTKLRVYLDRPWYVSGSGEMLGVVLPVALPPPSNGDGNGDGGGNGGGHGGSGGGGKNRPLPSTATPLIETDPLPVSAPSSPTAVSAMDSWHVTQWGLDPATVSAGLPVPFTPLPAQLPGGKQVSAAWFSFPQNYYFDTVVMPVVVAYEVQFEQPDPADPSAPADPATMPNNGRWFADIEIDTGAAYCPFIRLALTRYQSYNTVNDFSSCSAVVLADFVQLSPTRTATVKYDPSQPNAIDLAVQGVSPGTYQDPAGDLNRLRLGNRMTAAIEVNYADAGSEMWILAELGEQTLTLVSGESWSASLPLPFARGAQPMRVVLREYEQWPSDSADRHTTEGPVPYQRLVYADCFML